jgi:hypothetical protein
LTNVETTEFHSDKSKKEEKEELRMKRRRRRRYFEKRRKRRSIHQPAISPQVLSYRGTHRSSCPVL